MLREAAPFGDGRFLFARELSGRDEKMKITVLIENTSRDKRLIPEHGLSVYVETREHRLLVDTGASPAFLENAGLLGIDLGGVEMVVLSHGHYDHGGGIPVFAGRYPSVPIYLRENALERHCRPAEGGIKEIGLDREIRKLPQLVPVKGNQELGENLFLFTNVTGRELWPDGNRSLKREEQGKLVQDDFSHEQYLIVKEKGREILLSGCAHNGIINILEEAIRLRGRQPDAVISGFHTRKKQGYGEADLRMLRQMGRRLRAYQSVFYTGHCTGQEPFDILKQEMGEQIQPLNTGWQKEW